MGGCVSTPKSCVGGRVRSSKRRKNRTRRKIHKKRVVSSSSRLSDGSFDIRVPSFTNPTFQDLKPYKTKWRSQVKLLHSWQQKTSFGGETLQMVLTDEHGVKIQASCKREHIKSVQRKLPLGKWFFLTTFSISQATGQYRPTTHPYKMTIGDETVITPSGLMQDSIFLDLARFEDVLDGNLKKHFLIDVMGKIVSLKPVKTVQVKGQDRKVVQFRLADSSGNELACCLWGKYAEQLEDFDEREQPLICLIRFAKICFYQGEVQVTNAFDASIVYIDPTMEEALQLKEKLMEDNLPLAVIEKRNGKREVVLEEDDWNDLEIKMISELFVAHQVENCKIICSVEAVDIDWSWFYFGHKGCKHKAIKIGNGEKQLWRCGKCQVNITEVVPVFKLHLIVRDDTETCKLILLNTVATTIVGHDAVDLWDGSYDEIENPELLPEPIKELVGRSYCFGISVSSDNVTNGADTFKVLQIWSGDKFLKAESQSDPTSTIGPSSSSISSVDVLMLEDNSQNGSEECKTPFPKRKEGDADLPDISSTSKKLCKTIKVEKEKEV